MSDNASVRIASSDETTTDANRAGFRAAARLFARHQPVTISMVALGLIVPLYLFIGWEIVPGRTAYVPAVWLDDALPVEPAWSLVYLSLFLAALACDRIHRGVGAVAGLWAALVGVSTLYTKQHYVLDVISGALLAYLAYCVFLRGYPREATPALERQLAPRLAFGAVATYGLLVGILWIAYLGGMVV